MERKGESDNGGGFISTGPVSRGNFPIRRIKARAKASSPLGIMVLLARRSFSFLFFFLFVNRVIHSCYTSDGYSLYLELGRKKGGDVRDISPRHAINSSGGVFSRAVVSRLCRAG